MKSSNRIGDLLLKTVSLASLSVFMLGGTACAQQQDQDAWDQQKQGTAVTPKTVSSVYVPAPGAQQPAGAVPAYQITPQQREQLKTTMKQTAQQVGQATKDFKEFYAELQKAVQDSGIVEEVNKMNLGGSAASSSSAGAAGFGAADVKVAATSMTVTVDLPGVDKKNLAVSLAENSQLKIKVDRKSPDEPSDYQLSERYRGNFEKTIQLPYKAKGSSFKAELKNGVLTVTIPKEKTAALNEVPIPIS